MSRSIALPADGEAVTTVDLYRLTDEVIDGLLRLLRRCKDADVAFSPDDPLADDPGAEEGHEVNTGWTLGHIIAHATATAEESAALAAELARGVPYHGRSRQEVPWREITTVAQCRTRAQECRRLCLASLAMWPDRPDLGNTYIPWEGSSPMGATLRYLLGLHHAVAHFDQVRDVLAQARADRKRRTVWGRWRGRPAGGVRQPATVAANEPAS
jgi:hypothetical protein